MRVSTQRSTEAYSRSHHMQCSDGRTLPRSRVRCCWHSTTPVMPQPRRRRCADSSATTRGGPRGLLPKQRVRWCPVADTGDVPMSQMAREIFEQPEALERTLHQLAPQRRTLGRLRTTTRRVVFFARGSSDNAATYARYLCEIVAGIPAAVGAPSVGTLYDSRLDLSGTLAVIVSQSGRTDELVEVAEWTRRCGARTLAVTNDADSPLAAAVDIVVGTHAGPELAVPATKTYTTQLLALAVVVESLAATRRVF